MVLYPVRRPVRTLDCALFENRSLVFAVGLGPEIDFRACLWVVARVNSRLYEPECSPVYPRQKVLHVLQTRENRPKIYILSSI